ncbi:hypothetical protein [Pediococcus damnosus]|uniref:hypothetical protein n=1 Tax=Pediococcus damnosus TaxID=51663 RepID=UPI00078D68DF|nr:hypothetical protein [Pediococcus damnosus]AMV60760.1 Hypothetical protein ADU69_1099 [Pediococcus damnosus]
MKKRKWLYGALIFMGVLMIVLGGCGRKPQTSNKLHIVASLNFLWRNSKGRRWKVRHR